MFSFNVGQAGVSRRGFSSSCQTSCGSSAPVRSLRSVLWAHVDLNHGPHPYQGCALTGLSYGPRLVVKVDRFYRGDSAFSKSILLVQLISGAASPAHFEVTRSLGRGFEWFQGCVVTHDRELRRWGILLMLVTAICGIFSGSSLSLNEGESHVG